MRRGTDGPPELGGKRIAFPRATSKLKSMFGERFSSASSRLAFLLVSASLLSFAGCKWESPDPQPTPSPSPSPSPGPTATPTPTPFDVELGLSRNPTQAARARKAAPLIAQVAETEANRQFALAGLGIEAAARLQGVLGVVGQQDAGVTRVELSAVVQQLLSLHGQVESTNFFAGPEEGRGALIAPQSVLPTLESLSAAAQDYLASGSSIGVWPDPKEVLRQQMQEAATELSFFWQGHARTWSPSEKGNYRQAWFVDLENDPVGQMLGAQLHVGSYELARQSEQPVSPESSVVRGRLISLEAVLSGGDGTPGSLNVFGPGLLDLLAMANPTLAEQIPTVVAKLTQASEPVAYGVLRAELQGLLEQAAANFGYTWTEPDYAAE
jgi:hypothetical protein